METVSHGNKLGYQQDKNAGKMMFQIKHDFRKRFSLFSLWSYCRYVYGYQPAMVLGLVADFIHIFVGCSQFTIISQRV